MGRRPRDGGALYTLLSRMNERTNKLSLQLYIKDQRRLHGNGKIRLSKAYRKCTRGKENYKINSVMRTPCDKQMRERGAGDEVVELEERVMSRL